MSISDWQQFFEDGRNFHKTACGAVKRPEIFTPEIIQNIAAMAIEKYFMAIFMKRGFMPFNHTMTDLISAAAAMALPLKSDLIETLYYMDKLQQICSFDSFKITPPTETDIPRFIKAADDVAELAAKELKINVTAHENLNARF
ncbi:MAG: hypothetical protein LBP59_12900 [Planctomycetaceae bacterium]|jgi:hypothetical protein|nr:hypothetical protein [Planctomycetaceae bacterium]